MKKAQYILKKAISDISLDKNSEKKILKNSILLLKKLKSLGLNAKIGGSLAKNTLIKKEEQDVDIFILFDDLEKLKSFEKKIKSLKLKGEFIHGSRDYYKFKSQNIFFEIIPVLKVKKPEFVKNVTDFSIKHVDYVKNKINKNKKLANEIKLAKAFCKAQEVYGAESYINGFSGYSLEVLVIYYGSFLNFLKKAGKDNIVDPEKQFKNKNEILRELNESKILSPIILIDPVYKYRNVCAGLSDDTFNKFLISARNFLKKPSENFFIRKKFDVEKFKENSEKKGNLFIEFEFSTKKQEGDIAGTKMKKAFRFLIKQLENKQQIIEDNYFLYEGKGKISRGFISLKENKEIEITGPKKEMKKEVEKFKKVRKNIYFKKGFACAFEKISLTEILERQKQFVQGMDVEFKFNA